MPNNTDSRTIRPIVESGVGSPLGRIIHRTISGIFDLEEAYAQTMQSYNEAQAWLDNIFPNGKNQKELEDRYGSFVFSYNQCSNSNLEMRISSVDGKNTLTVTVNKKGWPVKVERIGYKPSTIEAHRMYASSNVETCFILSQRDSEGKTWMERYKESWK